MKKNIAVACAALWAVLTVGPANCADKPQYARRIWTNDDFASAPAAPAPAQAAPAPKAEPKPAPKALAPDPDIEAARKEVLGEVLATARARRKAYEDSIVIIQAKLQKEANPFRIDVLQKILKDTQDLSATNQRLLELLGEKTGVQTKDEPDKR